VADGPTGRRAGGRETPGRRIAMSNSTQWIIVIMCVIALFYLVITLGRSFAS
jgi:hypothetical protein